MENLKAVYQEFNYPLFKTPIDSDNELKQLQMFLPTYKAHIHTNKEQIQASLDVKEEIVDTDCMGEKYRKDRNRSLDDEAMEGYGNHFHTFVAQVLELLRFIGTDDESVTAIDTEMRKTLLKMAQTPDDHQMDQDDTQVADTGCSEEADFNKEALKNISRKLQFFVNVQWKNSASRVRHET